MQCYMEEQVLGSLFVMGTGFSLLWVGLCSQIIARVIDPEEQRNRSVYGLLNQVIGYYGQGPSNLLGVDLNSLVEDSDSEESNIFDSILQFLIDNDPNRFGPPPASNVAVSALNLKEITESLEVAGECAVCQDEFKIGDKFITMPCQHNFHQNCLLPWLKERNSCPTCRFELPTDDEEYEAKKNANESV